MDAAKRARVIAQLQQEAESSIVIALDMSQRWKIRSRQLTQQLGEDTHELYIAKRDDLRLKEYLSGYNWHRDNSTWADQMIKMLQGTTTTSSANG